VLAVFGVLALVLVGVGIYGVMSHSVAQRTREIGIRVALGAERRDLYTLILGQGFTIVLIGIASGVGAALTLSGVMGHLLYGVSATDPWILGGVCAVLSVAALLACAIPLRHATRIDPTIALRID
jgi:putative ABC transport system permease protein